MMTCFMRSMAACLAILAISVYAEDYGDAPDPGYPTLAATNGARHTVGTLFLGTAVDDDTDGQPNAGATGDDTDGANDDDGVAIPSSLFIGLNASITVTASEAGLLDAWIDFNADGDWDDTGEQIFTSRPLVAGENVLTVSVPPTATAGSAFARFRLSSAGGLAVTGLAADGEVEDYQVTISPVPTITSAAYNAGTGKLTVTGTDFPTNHGGDIDASAMTVTGEGGAAYTLTTTTDAEITNATTFTLELSAADKVAVNLLLNQNGTSSTGGTTYNLAAANGWAAAGGPTAAIADTTNAVTVTIPSSTVTFTSGGNGTIDGDTPQNVTYPGDCTPVTAVPATGFGFEKWTLAGADYSTDNPLTITHVATDMALTAVFRKTSPEIQVTYEDATDIPTGSPAGAGMGTDFGNTTVGESVRRNFHIHNLGGSTLTITSATTTAGSDYFITPPGTSIAAGGSIQFTIVFTPTALGTRTATVTIENDDADESTFTFDLSGVADNTPPVAITSASSTSAAVDATVQLSASGSYDPDNGPTTPLTYSWAFMEGPMTPTLSSNTAMAPTFVPSATGTYIYRLTVDDGNATDDEDIQVVVGTLHTITATAGVGGKVRLDTAGTTGIAGTTVREGVADGATSSDFVPVPDTGYEFVQWSDADTANPRQFATVAGDINVTAEFQLKSHTVNFIAGTGGSITGATSQTVTHGTSATATATPDAGARFVRWMDGLTEYSTDQTVVVDEVTADLTLTAEFAVGAPEIAVSLSGTDITNEGSIGIQSLVQKDFTFTISNTGDTTLDLAAAPRIILGGSHTSQFELLTAPGQHIAADGQGTFILRYKPTIGATHALTITISNNDPDEAPFTFTVNASAHTHKSNACATGGSTPGNILLPLIATMVLLIALRRRIGYAPMRR